MSYHNKEKFLKKQRSETVKQEDMSNMIYEYKRNSLLTK